MRLKVAAAPRAQLVGVHDPDAARAELVGRETGAPVRALDALLEECQAVVIAAPAEAHHGLATRALEAGCHVLVEKPIAATLVQADALAALAAERRLVLQVGHLLRFSAEHRAISSRITRPLYIEATRIAPYKPRGTDVSVILDLMIHDLDLVLSLVDSEIASVDALGGGGFLADGGHRQRQGAIRQWLRGDDYGEPNLDQDGAADAAVLAGGLSVGGLWRA